MTYSTSGSGNLGISGETDTLHLIYPMLSVEWVALWFDVNYTAFGLAGKQKPGCWSLCYNATRITMKGRDSALFHTIHKCCFSFDLWTCMETEAYIVSPCFLRYHLRSPQRGKCVQLGLEQSVHAPLYLHPDFTHRHPLDITWMLSLQRHVSPLWWRQRVGSGACGPIPEGNFSQ